MIFVGLLRVHARIAWRQKTLRYTSIPLTLFAVSLSLGGKAPNTKDIRDLVYRMQVMAIFVDIIYAAVFTSLLSAPVHLGISELESSASVDFIKLQMARVLGSFTAAIVSPLAFLFVVGTIQTAQGRWGGPPMALAVTISTIALAVLCSTAISVFMESSLPQAFMCIVTVLAWFYPVFLTPAIPVPAPKGTIFGVIGGAVVQGYFGSRLLYAPTGPFSSSSEPVTATVSLLWRLILIAMLLAIGSRLSECFQGR